MRSRKILVTGSSGFVGSHLVDRLLNNKYDFVAASRSFWSGNDKGSMRSPELGANADWTRILKGCETVVHLAARAHMLDECGGREAEEIYNQTNEKGTSRLVSQAIDAGVKRFIFISSIGAVAEKSNKPLNPHDRCTPVTPYGRSKLGAERAIQEICSGNKMNYTIIRPPLVYGPRNPGNMAKLIKIADSCIPMPLSAFDSNRRSFVGVSNLIDLILLCLEHPAAANQTFHVSDDDDISTAELLRRMGKALGKPVRNIPLPQAALKAGLRLIGKGEWVDKLCGDLRVDISETKRLLGWKPKVTMGEELERTAKWWREREK
jgi:UDP-glucose 4-epimerase